MRYAVLGGLALALFFGAVGATWIFLKGGFHGGVAVDAVFSSRGVGQQLPLNGDVKVRGVLVGRIDDVELTDDGNAVVHMVLDEGHDLDAGSVAEIRSKTVFGQKWVELIQPRSATGGVLAAGSVIPNDRTNEPLELENALQLGHELLSEIPLADLSTVLRTLAEGFSGSERAARRSIDRGLVALRAVNSRSEEFDLSLRQLREFSAWLNDEDETLLGFMASLDSANRALVGAAPEFQASLDSVPAFLNDFAAFQERTESDFGRLVEDGATVAEVVAAKSANLEDIVVQLEPFTTVWNSGLSQPCRGAYEENLTCWQVFQMPGIDSRGLFGRGVGPAGDEAGDPLKVIAPSTEMTATEFRRLLREYGSGDVTLNLARMLYVSSRDVAEAEPAP
ncbi:MAG: MlaD family protein [Actinomycetota bacterium]